MKSSFGPCGSEKKSARKINECPSYYDFPPVVIFLYCYNHSTPQGVCQCNFENFFVKISSFLRFFLGNFTKSAKKSGRFGPQNGRYSAPLLPAPQDVAPRGKSLFFGATWTASAQNSSTPRPSPSPASPKERGSFGSGCSRGSISPPPSPN